MAQCRHGIEIGLACGGCGGIAKTLKRTNSRNNLGPDALPMPAALGNAAIAGPAPVHLPALTIDTATRSGPEMLTELYDCLVSRTGFVLSCPTCASTLAVCWNWVLFGAAREAETDPIWAYLYVQGQPLPIGLVSSPGLDEARNALARAPRFPSQVAIRRVHVAILADLLGRSGFVLEEGSGLSVRVWYRYADNKAVTYTHMEFVYSAGAACITISKTAGGASESGEVTCYAGSSELFDHTLVYIELGIDVCTLSAQHLRVLAQLCGAIPAERPAKLARKREHPGERKDGEK